MTNATSTQLQELYVAYFGRAADPAGLDYWVEAGITTEKFAADMYLQAEFADSFGSKSLDAQVNQIYKNLFDRAADVDGLDYWVQQINLGVLKVAEIATHLIWAAQNIEANADDKTALANRTAAAEAYTAEVAKTTEARVAYAAKSTSPTFEAGVNITEAISYLSGIDGTTAHTEAGVVASVATIVSNGPAADYVAPTPAATYTVTPSSTAVDEGGTLTTTVATTNVDAGTTLYYSLSGTSITGSDLSEGSLTGSANVGTDGSLTFSHTLASDVTTEGSETLNIKLFSDSARSTQVGSTASVTIGDTSLTAAVEDTAETFTLTSGIDTFTGGSKDDIFTATNTTTSTTASALDSLTGGAGTDTFNISDTSGLAYTLPSTFTLSSIEKIQLTTESNAAADVIVANVQDYADVDTLTIANISANATAAINTVTVTSNANLQTLTVDGGSGSDIAAVIFDETTITATATVANTDVLSSLTITGITGAGTVASDSLTSITVKNAAGVVTNTDDFIVSTDTRTLTVTHNGGTNGGVTDAGATTANVNVDASTTNAGINTFAAATTLNVDTNAVLTAGTIVVAAATDVNINMDAAVTAMTVTSNAAQTIDFTGAANGTITQNGTASAVITNSSTGDLTLATAIAAGQTYTGGSGDDTITQAGTGTTANTTGAGDDTVTFSAVAGAGGSVDAGAGTADTVSLTAALSANLSAATAFEADIANFERLTVGAYADLNTGNGTTIALANLDDINHVTVAGSAAQTQAEALIISGFTTGGTYRQTALLNTNANQAITGTFTGASDTMNLAVSATNGFANVGSLTVAAVETLNINTDDTNTVAATTMVDLNMDAAAATTINVTGDIGITFANGTHAAVATMDASGVTATGAAGVVTFTATAASTLTGGAGNDALTGGANNDTIKGNAGTDALVGGAGVDTITGGAGADTITGGTGADTLTGGAGADIFVFADADSTTAASDTITDYNGEVIRLVAGDDVAGVSANANNATTDVTITANGKATFNAADDTLAEKLVTLAADTTDIGANEVVFFEHGSDTYIFNNVGGTDDLVKLTGITGMTTLTESAATAGDFTLS